ncbi:putative movement protein [Oat golden stripe virus]|uniref:Putative movement protein n=1 Tax=Oat golden stripe virus TaxID=45103 RepID=Q9QBU7_9VIRU|nr:putative movement protein [Oat golden stripe virus]CAB57884.1 putative movement protein [Oat golden stripe virus]
MSTKNISKDVTGSSYAEVYNGMLDAMAEKNPDDESLVTNRQRSFNVVNKYVEKALVQDKAITKMRALWTEFTDRNGEKGTPYNMTYSCVLLNIIPTVPKGYPGTVVVKLIDSGLSLLDNVIPDQSQMMELGMGPCVMCFFTNYSIPINDVGRAVNLAFQIDAEMASKHMSVMNVYAYWHVKSNFLSSYPEPQKSTVSQLILGYDKSLTLKTRGDVRRFVGRSLNLASLVPKVPDLLPAHINVNKENVPLLRKEEFIDLTKAERQKDKDLADLKERSKISQARNAAEMRRRASSLSAAEAEKTAAADVAAKLKAKNAPDISFGNF